MMFLHSTMGCSTELMFVYVSWAPMSGFAAPIFNRAKTSIRKGHSDLLWTLIFYIFSHSTLLVPGMDYC